MLKLEKVSQSRDLHVILRDKPSLLSYSLLVALTYALLFHLAAVLLFQVSPFKISYSPSVITPVHVDLNFLSSDSLQQALAEYHEPSYVPEYLIVPQSPPRELAVALTVDPVKLMPEDRVLFGQSFSVLEDRLELPYISYFAGRDFSPIKFMVSGALAHLEISADLEVLREKLALFTRHKPAALSQGPHRFVFAVQVEEHRGEIFWWDLKSENSDSELSRLAADMLQHFRFVSPFNFVQSGQIELIFTDFLEHL